MSQLQTNWIRIATAGNAIDGRVIDADMLTEMAELYNPDEYTARIWPDHRRWFGAWGDVIALKVEEWQGKLRLFAKLRPNSMLMQANEADQKTFCSIEIDVKNFDGTGKHYLAGMGVTDEPGSLGTEKLKFNKSMTSLYSEPELFAIEEVEEIPEKAESRFKKVLNLFNSEPEKSKVDTVEKEQFEQLFSGIKAIAEKQDEQAEKIQAIETRFNKDEPEADPVEPEAQPEKGDSSEQFTKLLEAVESISSKQDELATKFAKLEEESPGQRPSKTGGNDGNGVQLI